jgi:hypothetical protein
MKFLRILIASLMVFVIVAGGAAAIAWHNQERLINLVLSRIHAETGYNIVPAGARLALRSHLVVVLEKPRIYLNGAEVAQVDDLRAVIGIHAIFSTNGLPLYAIALDRPRVRIPAGLAGVTPHGFPKPDVAVADKLKWVLDAVSDVAQRIEIVDAALIDVDGSPLIDKLTLTAYRQHRGFGHWPWMVNFEAAWNHAPFAGVNVSGRLRLGKSGNRNGANLAVPSGSISGSSPTITSSATAAPSVTAPSKAALPPPPPTALEMVSSGSLSFSGLELAPFQGPYGIKLTGRLSGSMNYGLRQDGELFADTISSGKQLVLNGKPFTAPIALPDATLHAAYKASTERLEVKEFTLTQKGTVLVTGGGSVDHPYDDARTAAFHLEGLQISLMQAVAWSRVLRAIPPSVLSLANQITAGRAEFSEVVFNPTTPVKDWSARTLRESLSVHATIDAAGFSPPASLKLPPIQNANLALQYADGHLIFTDGSASVGRSEVSGISGQIGINHAPEAISYKLSGTGGLDLGELYPALAQVLADNAPKFAARITAISGTSVFNFHAVDKISNLQWSAPVVYALKFSPEHVEFTIKGAPSPIAIKAGTVEVIPSAVTINQMVVAPTMPQSGNAVLNGTLITDQSHPIFQDFTADLHEIRVETWLPLILKPKQFGVDGAVGGRLTAQSNERAPGFPTVTGKLTMGPGDLHLGFLRSPIAASSMTVLLDGKGMKLDLPSGQLEGHPVSLTIALADFDHPVVELNARNSFLDFEVMKFIRMPWSPKTPVEMFDLAIRGHIEADHAVFGKLPLANVNTDFDRMNGEWHVKDLTARALDGDVRVDLAGRSGADNHIRIKSRIDGMDAGALCLLAGESKPALTGRLNATADLTGDTDVDFFASLGGILGVQVQKGTLNRLALMTRVLSFIDLKNWLTAKLPDPRVAGIPFDTLTATLNGAAGDFNTQDLQLSGPVMEIRARGDVRLSDSTVNLEISLIPFDTVDWLVRKIPIIGNNLSGGSKGLLAAYFHVSGPIGNPTVRPKPITSVAEFVAKTLSLPINIIRPNTINP